MLVCRRRGAVPPCREPGQFHQRLGRGRPWAGPALATALLALCLACALGAVPARAASRTQSYAYDPAGRLALVSYDSSSSYVFSYDHTANLRQSAFVSDDADGDGLSDAWEGANGQTDPSADTDQDGLTALQESLLGTNPGKADSDGDGFSDGAEFQAGSDPLSAASTPAGYRVVNMDLLLKATLSDDDQLPDDWEIDYFGNLDQTETGDPDGDGLNNLAEYQRGTDPTKADSDGDGYSDGDEVAMGSDPLDPASQPGSALSWIMLLLKR